MIQQAREVAVRRKTTLNQLFRDWLAEVVGLEVLALTVLLTQAVLEEVV